MALQMKEASPAMKMYRSLTELIGHTPLLALTGYCR